MTKIFFDIETYSPNVTQRIKFNDKIITIGYKYESSDITILKEWESSERQIIKRFLDIIKNSDRPNLVGHNILRFDIPMLICRSRENHLGTLNELMTLFLESYPIDTIQCLLPSNRLYFRGLGLRNCAEYLGIVITGCPSTEIKTHYEQSNYEAIIHHNTEDILITEKIYNQLLSCSFKPFRN
jgi:DNA polymerase elongation subunit (family B)